MMTRRLILAACLLLPLASHAQTTVQTTAPSSAAGLWKTIDDQTGKPKSLVRITEVNGQYQGKIEKLFRGPGEDPDPKCEQCEGSNHGQPILGMTIITGMRPENGEYDGGRILDPASGKVYKSTMRLIDDGKKLNVRGYVGMPLFGRTQTWLREE